MNNLDISAPKPSTKAKSKYNKKTYKRVFLYVKNDEMDVIENFCKAHNFSKNNLFIQSVKTQIEKITRQKFDELLTEKIERDTGKKFNEFLNESQDKTDNGFSDGSQVNQLKCGSEENP